MLRTSLKEKEAPPRLKIHHRVEEQPGHVVHQSDCKLQLMEESDEAGSTGQNCLDSTETGSAPWRPIHEDLYSTTDFSAVTFTNIVGKLTR